MRLPKIGQDMMFSPRTTEALLEVDWRNTTRLGCRTPGNERSMGYRVTWEITLSVSLKGGRIDVFVCHKKPTLNSLKICVLLRPPLA
jgi:hypothetical protein